MSFTLNALPLGSREKQRRKVDGSVLHHCTFSPIQLSPAETAVEVLVHKKTQPPAITVGTDETDTTQMKESSHAGGGDCVVSDKISRVDYAGSYRMHASSTTKRTMVEVPVDGRPCVRLLDFLPSEQAVARCYNPPLDLTWRYTAPVHSSSNNVSDGVLPTSAAETVWVHDTWTFSSAHFAPAGNAADAAFVTTQPLLDITEALAVSRELIGRLGDSLFPRPMPKVRGKRQFSPRHVAIVARQAPLLTATDSTKLPQARELSYSYRHLPAAEHPVINLDLLPLVKALVVERAETLFPGKTFSLAHISLYTEHGDKMGLHDDHANTVGDYVVNVSLLAPREFILGDETFWTRSGHAIVFRKSTKHGVKPCKGAALVEQTMLSGVLVPRLSISLRCGATAVGRGTRAVQEFVRSLPEVPRPIYVRVGPRQLSDWRRIRPVLLNGHADRLEVGTLFRERLAVNLSGVMLAVQGAADFKKASGGLATSLVADLRGTARKATYENRRIDFGKPSSVADPPDILLYSAQCAGSVSERVAFPCAEMRHDHHYLATLSFNGRTSNVDVALLRSCLARQPVRVVGRVASADVDDVQTTLEAIYVYWGVYAVQEIVGVQLLTANCSEALKDADRDDELRYFVLVRLQDPGRHVAPHDKICQCDGCEERDLHGQNKARAYIQNKHPARLPELLACDLDFNVDSGTALVREYMFPHLPATAVRTIVDMFAGDDSWQYNKEHSRVFEGWLQADDSNVEDKISDEGSFDAFADGMESINGTKGTDDTAAQDRAAAILLQLSSAVS